MEDQVRQLAFYDPLTQLPNRRLLIDRLNQALASSKRSGRHGAVMFLDLDNFKTLNDTHGHAVGDLLLIEVSNRLRASVREMDTVARIGGDEFVVMFREFDGERGASQVQAGAIAEKIRLGLSEPYRLKTQDHHGATVTVEHHCTASIGVVLFLGDGASQDEIFKHADAAMYQAKAAGRNTIRFHEGTSA
jgi:diguanylate cyclase (GGDEF)-like protein